MAVSDYELILMLDPQAADDAREKIASDAKSRLESQGTLNNEANWGMRKMAYEIDKRPEADYRYYRFAGEKPLLDELNHTLRITDGVLRFRIFKVDADAPMITPPDTEQIMRRDEDDDRGRGRGRGRDDRGPRRPRSDDAGSGDSAPAPAAAAPAEPAAAEPAPAEPTAAEAPAEPAAAEPTAS